MLDFNEKKGFICDMDGVIYHGNRVLPGVNEFLEWLKSNNKEFLFLTRYNYQYRQELRLLPILFSLYKDFTECR